MREVSDVSEINKDTEILAKGASISFAGKLLGGGIEAVAQIVLARNLGVELFGLLALAWSVVRIGGTFITLGLDKGVIHFGAKYWPTNKPGCQKVLVGSITSATLSGMVFGVILFFLSAWLEQFFNQPGLATIFRITAFIFPLVACLKVAAASTRISQSMRYTAITEDVGQPLVNLTLVCFAILLGWQLYGALAAYLISFLVTCALSIYFVWSVFRMSFSYPFSVAQPRLSRMLRYSLTTTLAGMFIILTTWGNRMFLGYYATASEVGIFQAVAQIPIMFTITLNALNGIFSPIIASLYQHNQMPRLRELYKVSTKWGLYTSLPIFLLICFSAKDLLVLLFGDEYAVGANALLVLAAAQLLNVATGSVGVLLIMTGNQRQWGWISGIMLIISVVLNLILVPRFGVLGAALATAGTISGLFLVGLFWIKTSLGLWPYDRRYLKGIFAAGISAALMFGIRPITPESPLLREIILGFIAVVVFAGTLLLQGLDDEDKLFVSLLRTRFGRSG